MLLRECVRFNAQHWCLRIASSNTSESMIDYLLDIELRKSQAEVLANVTQEYHGTAPHTLVKLWSADTRWCRSLNVLSGSRSYLT
jgi:hypothetical protein